MVIVNFFYAINTSNAYVKMVKLNKIKNSILSPNYIQIIRI